MIKRTTKLRWRRRVRQRQKQFEGLGSQTEESLDKHFFRRLGRLYEVRRFLISWLLLVISLIAALIVQTRALGDYFLEIVPQPGGIYSEGLIGSYTNSNPIFASTDVDTAMSRLLFSGLLTYDKNNVLAGDLATEWSVDESGKVYTVKLNEDVRWHDGEPFTAKDVIFTFQSIQNPDVRSPFFSAWQGIKLEAPDEYTVIFTLNNVWASFPHSLTTGIIPEHLLKDNKPADLRGALFNTIEPIGTGPFQWNDVQVYGDTTDSREQRIALRAYDDYHRSRPKIAEFIVRAFLDEAALVDSFSNGELSAVAGAQSEPLSSSTSQELNIPLTGSVMIFFRTSQEILADAKVRRALTMATDRKEVIRALNQQSVPVDAPLLKEHIGYNPDVVQYGFDKDQAAKLLDEAGWKLDASGTARFKGDKKLILSISTLSSVEYAAVAHNVKDQWREVGVEVQVNSMPQAELQLVIDERGYDTLIYGIVMGTDPDQFAYWHSSQSDVRSQRRLNFSDYKSSTVDSALESGRTRNDAELRAAKYLPFLQSWREDAPAVALYRPRFVYTTYSKVYNFNVNGMNIPTDRFNNVHEWMIRTTRSIQ